MRRARWKRWVVVGMMAGAAWLMAGFYQEAQSMETFRRYQGSRSQLPVSFEYPAEWQLEESSGTREAYWQVQVYGPESVEARLRTYLVVRAVPPKAEGGRYEGVSQMVESYRKTLQPGLRVEGERRISVSGLPAIRLDLSGALRLPWKSPKAVPIAVKSQRIFLENEGRLYELGWMATPEAAATVEAAFAHVLRTLVVDGP